MLLVYDCYIISFDTFITSEFVEMTALSNFTMYRDLIASSLSQIIILHFIRIILPIFRVEAQLE